MGTIYLISIPIIYIFVGKTGSGKTTLIKLLAKMYDIETGSILINDKNIKELDVKDFTSIYVLYPKTVEFLTHCL